MRRVDGSWLVDWAFVRLAINHARWVLQRHLIDARLPHGLTSKAYDASEDLRTSAPFATERHVIQAWVIRVVPVVQRVLRTLAAAKKSA